MSKANPTKPELHGAEHDPNGNDPITISKIWPIGSVYISIISTNPGTLMGFGTWAAFGAGKVLVGLDSGDPDFDTSEETGGAKTVTPSIDDHAAHVHSGPAAHSTAATGTSGTGLRFAAGAASHGNTGNPTAPLTHTENPSSVVQPYIVVYMWKRTA